MQCEYRCPGGRDGERVACERDATHELVYPEEGAWRHLVCVFHAITLKSWAGQSIHNRALWPTAAKLSARDNFNPACLVSMGCLCAAHARGASADQPCNASE